jgi:hypothetical protein
MEEKGKKELGERGVEKRERLRERERPSSIEVSTAFPAWSSALMSVHNTVSMSTELN